MLAPSALIKGIVSRLLGTPTSDGVESEGYVRLGRYRDIKVESCWPTDHLLADEGAVMVATTLPGATALQLGISASFSATAAAFVIGNSDAAGGKRIYLKSLKLAQSVAPTSGTDLRYAVVLDSKDRTPSTISNGAGGSGPGTPANNTAYRSTVVSTNQDIQQVAPVGVAFFPISTAGGSPVTVPTPGQFARTIVGNGYIKNSIPVVKDQYVIQFGSCDTGGTFQAAAALSKIVEHAPPVVIGPGQFAVIHMWSASNITAGNAWDDVQLVWVEK
jgi:hypothetical protein